MKNKNIKITIYASVSSAVIFLISGFFYLCSNLILGMEYMNINTYLIFYILVELKKLAFAKEIK